MSFRSLVANNGSARFSQSPPVNGHFDRRGSASKARVAVGVFPNAVMGWRRWVLDLKLLKTVTGRDDDNKETDTLDHMNDQMRLSIF